MLFTSEIEEMMVSGTPMPRNPTSSLPDRTLNGRTAIVVAPPREQPQAAGPTT